MAIEDDDRVDDVTAVNASQSKDSVASLVDDLGHSQTGAACALHHLSFVTRLKVVATHSGGRLWLNRELPVPKCSESAHESGGQPH